MNKKHYKKVLDLIISNPESWDQTKWHCETSHCFAGHAQNLWRNQICHGYIGTEIVRQEARLYVGLTKFEADYLFSVYRTFKDFQEFLEKYDDPTFIYYVDGYNKDGYDKDGYDDDGLDFYLNPRTNR